MASGLLRMVWALVLCGALASCGAEPAFAQSAPVGSAPSYPNGQGGTDYSKGFVFVAPPAQPNGCVFLGSTPCPLNINGSTYSYAHISTSTTTILATVAGHLLGRVCVNKAGTTGSVTVDDAATATTPAVAILDSTVVGCRDYDDQLLHGLTIVTTGAPDVTVSWR